MNPIQNPMKIISKIRINQGIFGMIILIKTTKDFKKVIKNFSIKHFNLKCQDKME